MTLMEPNSFIFLTLISNCFKVVQWPFVFLRNTPDDPFLNQNHWIALNATFSLTADPQLTPRPAKIKNEIPNPSLLKKNAVK